MILNFKGGTTKTTTTRNLAYLLATDYKKKVLLIDLDSSGNLSDSLRWDPKERFHLKEKLSACLEDIKNCRKNGEESSALAALNEEKKYIETELAKNPARSCRPPQGCGNDFGLASVMLDDNADPHKYIIHTTIPGVDILPGGDTLTTVEARLSKDRDKITQVILRKQLKKVQDEYDFCIMDGPPSDDILVTNALAAAHEVIVPTTINQDSLDAIVRIRLKMAKVEDYNPALTLRGVLMVKMTNNKVDKSGAAIIDNKLQYPRFNTFIRSSTDVEKSRFANVSVREFNRSNPVAIDYDNFVAEYLGLQPVHPVAPYLIWPNDQ